MIDIVVAHPAADNQLAVAQPLDGFARQAHVVVDHDGVGVFDTTGDLFLAVGIEAHDVGQAAENAFLRIELIGNKIGDNNLIPALHRSFLEFRWIGAASMI